MPEVVRRSYRLAIQSFRVLRRDPALMVFPVLSFTGLAAALLLMGSSLQRVGQFPVYDETTAVGIAGLFLAYLVAYFIVIYFKVALVACVMLRLAGGAPSIRYGIGIASDRIGAIFSWVVIAAVVGVALRLLGSVARRRSGAVGDTVASIAAGLVGAAWSVATFFVVPVIAAQGVGGIHAAKRSAAIVRKRWGEALVGAAGVQLIVVLVGLVVMLALLLLAITSWIVLGSAWVGVIFMYGIGLAFVLNVVAGATLDTIYAAVVHRFATTGQASGGFTAAELEGSFRTNPRSRPEPGLTPRFPAT